MISKLIKNGENIFLQTTTDAVINNRNKTLSDIIIDLENKISDLVTENENLKKQISDLEVNLTNKITEGDTNLDNKITALTGRVETLETDGADYEARIQMLEKKTSRLGESGNFNQQVSAPGFFER